LSARQYAYATGARLTTLHWRQRDPLIWPAFVAWLKLDDPADHKECGGYVAGELQETQGHPKDPECVALHRNRNAVVSRSIVALDADSASKAFLADVGLELDGTATVAYTTWSHTPETPRWRLLVPLARDVTPPEYRLIADAMMHELGSHQFDRSSREPERLMYRPSTQGSYQHAVLDGAPADPEYWLRRAVELDLDREQPVIAEYQGDAAYADLTYDQQQQADGVVEAQLGYWRDVWAEAREWPEGHYPEGKGWEKLAADCAWAFARMAVCPWMGLDADGADLFYHEIVPEEVLEALREDRNEKSVESLLEKAAGVPVNAPPWEVDDFDVWHTDAPNPLEGLNDYDPGDISSDLQLGKRVAREYLRGRYLAWGRSAWALWDGRRWDIGVSEDVVNGDVREALLHIRKEEIARADARRDRELARASGNSAREKQAIAAHTNRMKEVTRLSRAETLNNAKRLARPDLVVRLEEFDGPETADLLNVGNGVVDLRTGELRQHDPALKFTKLTETRYVPGAEHPDWKTALGALPPDVTGWVQRKFGQGATGHAPTDEIVLFMRGGGENGKTTFLVGVRAALGDYYVTVPDKVLEGNPKDHSTEFMPLKGARLAVIEELPGGDWLTGTRLKKAEGSETGMTARPVNQDNVTWVPSHMLLATTNHLIQVTDTDHGTRRRLCDLNFPYTFTGEERDTGLKGRLKAGTNGQHEAVLAWLVAGAKATYEQPLEREHMPVQVRADTDAWLAVTNPAEEFLTLALEYDPGRSVLSSDVYAEYRDWAQANGRRVMSDQSFWERARRASIFTLPDVRRDRVRAYGDLVTRDGEKREGKQRVITCVRWSGEMKAKILGFA